MFPQQIGAQQAVGVAQAIDINAIMNMMIMLMIVVMMMKMMTKATEAV